MTWSVAPPDTGGLIGAQLPCDRDPYEYRSKAVLLWTAEDLLGTGDFDQVDLQLAGHARAVASHVRRRAYQLRKDNDLRALDDAVLREVGGRLCAPLEGTER
ncbi:restriction endonuclease [Streptomyces sp. SID1121]|uniref:restriction endonuclease n=1 Tax=Streptomyces sp. SID1121 TaxID=3425888 RepID=UPI004057905D